MENKGRAPWQAKGHGTAVGQDSVRERISGSKGVVLLGILMVVPTLLVLLASRLGPGISPDSVNYASAARSFMESGSLVAYSGRPLTIFPPGLPILLGLCEWVGMDLQWAAIGLNLLCAALTVGLTHRLASQLFDSPNLGLAVAAVVSLSASMVRVYAMLWTEPSFSVLVLLVLVILIRAIHRNGISLGQAALAALLVSFATTLRFVGVLLIPVAVLGVLFAQRRRGPLLASCWGLGMGCSSALGFLVVAMRNRALGTGLMGDRLASHQRVGDIMERSLLTLGEYLVSPSRHALIWLAGIALALGLLYGVWQAFRAHRLDLILLASWVGVYWMCLWYSQMATLIDPVGERLTAPAFAPMVILIAYGLRCLSLRFVPGGAMKKRLGLICLGLILGFTCTRAIRFARRAAGRGIGYNNVNILLSPLARAIANSRDSGGLASTDPQLIYWVSRRKPVLQIPMRDFYNPPEQTTLDLASLRQAVTSGAVSRLAFFNADTAALSPDEIAQVPGITLHHLATFEDGRLYEATPVGRLALEGVATHP